MIGMIRAGRGQSRVRVTRNTTDGRQVHVRSACTALVATMMIMSTAGGLMIMDPNDPVTFGDPTGNTTNPAFSMFPNFPYWNSTEGRNTYLGDGILIRVNHVGAPPTIGSPVTVLGVSATVVDRQLLQHPFDPNDITDLWLWKIDTPLALSTLYPITQPLSNGDDVIMTGKGHRRANDRTLWDIQVVAGPGNDIWTAGASGPNAEAKGFLTVSDNVRRWGTNKVALANLDLDFGGGIGVAGFSTDFSFTNATAWEAQGTNDDSSGPVFVFQDGAWRLAGLIHSVTGFDGQPTNQQGIVAVDEYNLFDPSGLTSSYTSISDLSHYEDQLIAFGVVMPEPAIGSSVILAALLLARRRRHRWSHS